ncbi:hypothetical protein ACCO45_001968 [Purpureocillium lilacinum]|uniref:Uncharacterized protein n=1 Tax=Purpureocillium lilacinum TaxID=33203 RepID=A0ACC4EB09_PURLI
MRRPRSGASPPRSLLRLPRPPRVVEPDAREEADPQRCAGVHPRHVSPISRVPTRDVVVYRGAELLHGVEVAKVGDEQNQQHSSPHAQVPRRSKHERLIDGEEQVHVGELGHGHRRAQGHLRRSRGGVEQLEIPLLAEVVVEGPARADSGSMSRKKARYATGRRRATRCEAIVSRRKMIS